MLADAGWQVLVLEATAEPGGSVRTAELTAPGYRSDLCSAFYPLAVASPAIRELGLESYGLGWRHAPAVLAHVFPDGRHAMISRDIERTAASVAAFAPQDADAWRGEFALLAAGARRPARRAAAAVPAGAGRHPAAARAGRGRVAAAGADADPAGARARPRAVRR